MEGILPPRAWILDFLLPQEQTDDSAVLPFMSLFSHAINDNPRLRTRSPLRNLCSILKKDSDLEEAIETLEIIHKHGYLKSDKVLNLIDKAWCAVEKDFAVGQLKKNIRNFYVIDRNLKRREKDTHLKLDWWKEIKGEIMKRNEHEYLAYISSMETRTPALDALREFLEAATEEMGPSYVETQGVVEISDDSGDAADDMCCSDLSRNEGKIVQAPECGKEIQKGKAICQEMDPSTSKSALEKVNEQFVETPFQANASIDSEECCVNVLDDNLEGHVSTNVAEEVVNDEQPAENKSNFDMDAHDCSVSEECVILQPKEGDVGCSAAVSRRSSRKRNVTACNFECDEVEFSEESSDRRRLSRHKRRIVAAPRNREVTPFLGRRQIKRWSELEEQALRDGVEEFGRGKWALILDKYGAKFEGRTAVDLKDKWRNLTKNS